jgi:hypothetical protein
MSFASGIKPDRALSLAPPPFIWIADRVVTRSLASAKTIGETVARRQDRIFTNLTDVTTVL